MNNPTIRIATGLIAVSLISGAAQAALIDRGGGLIYDTDLNVTWLADANYAQTSGYDGDGVMQWSEALFWADNLSYFDSVRNVTYTDWRLPTTTDTGTPGGQCSFGGTDCGFNVDPASSEMAHLFFVELGNTTGYTPDGTFKGGTSGVDWGLVNEGLFTNFQSGRYWSGTEYTVPVPGSSWYFDTYFGYQGINYYDEPSNFYALAVRPGDVAAVPEVETYALMLAGLGLVAWRGRQRR